MTIAMSRGAHSGASDRVRYPFITPFEKEEMQAALQRDQSVDTFDNRAPLALDGRGHIGFLGVPKKEVAPPSARRSRSIRSRFGTVEGYVESVLPPQARAAGTDEQLPPAPAPAIAMVESAQPVQEPEFIETEEMARIKSWLLAEVGKIEGELTSHLGRDNALSVVPDEVAAAHDVMPLATADRGEQLSARRPHWFSEPIDLDEARDRKLAHSDLSDAKTHDPSAARAAVPPQFIPKSARGADEDGDLRSSGLRLSCPVSSGLADDDIPAFLRTPINRPSVPDTRGETAPARVRRGSGSLDAMMPVRPVGTQSTLGALILAYAVFILIPLTEWISGTLDPRIGAIVPGVAFLGWLSIHLL